MVSMLRMLKLPQIGRHHSGIGMQLLHWYAPNTYTVVCMCIACLFPTTLPQSWKSSGCEIDSACAGYSDIGLIFLLIFCSHLYVSSVIYSTSQDIWLKLLPCPRQCITCPLWHLEAVKGKECHRKVYHRGWLHVLFVEVFMTALYNVSV